ncbi:MAG: DUF2339 domain-containing protein [Verrucomicrobia bacterium]|nr:DUF2339 domain-containing protein [Verrucomicrobiota bacterium]
MSRNASASGPTWPLPSWCSLWPCGEAAAKPWWPWPFMPPPRSPHSGSATTSSWTFTGRTSSRCWRSSRCTGASLWRFVCCWVPTADIFLTMSWAGLAVLMFAAGMLLRERFYRWFGLAVLAASVGRVVFVDMWKQETIYRVLTIMVLGVALVAVGFVYNKFQDAIRKWL